MQRTEPEPAEPDDPRQATPHRGAASLTETAGRAPSGRCAPTARERGAGSGTRLPAQGRDQPRRGGGRRAARTGRARGAHAHVGKDAR
ncbi:DUF6380 family protein [Streptomyces sp. NPDC002343]